MTFSGSPKKMPGSTASRHTSASYLTPPWLRDRERKDAIMAETERKNTSPNGGSVVRVSMAVSRNAAKGYASVLRRAVNAPANYVNLPVNVVNQPSNVCIEYVSG